MFLLFFFKILVSRPNHLLQRSSTMSLINQILFYSRHPRSLPFRKPVDPVALGIFPAYNQIITHPIDLGTIKTQIGKIHSFWTKNWTFREL